jgi:hypothetical protein
MPTELAPLDAPAIPETAHQHLVTRVPTAAPGAGVHDARAVLQALMEVLRREHVEDLHRFASIHRETEIAARGLSLSSKPLARLLGGEPRTGSDPAFGSGPVATIAQDVPSLLIYFGTVSLLVL